MTEARLRVETHTLPPESYEIVAREQAIGPHPHPSQNRRPVQITGAAKLLVLVPDPNGGDPNDGELYECNECGWTHTKLQSVVAHMNAHSASKHDSDYDESTIRHVLRIAKRMQRDNSRAWAAATADELNITRVKPQRAQQWSAGLVSGFVKTYSGKYRVNMPRVKTEAAPIATQPATAAAAAAANAAPLRRSAVQTTLAAPAAPASPSIQSADIQRIMTNARGIVATLRSTADELMELTNDIAALQVTDSDVLKKAALVDQLRDMGILK